MSAAETPKQLAARRLVVLLALLVAGLQLSRFTEPEYAIDDAYITFRTARTWLETGVPTFDAAQPPVEGSTTTSWVVLAALWEWLTPQVDPMVWARIVGALCHLATVWVLVRLSVRWATRLGGDATTASAVTAVLINVSGWVAFHAFSGMETALYSLLFVAALDRLTAFHDTGRDREAGLTGACLAALAVTRPEGVLIAALASLLVVVRPELRRAWKTIVLPGVLTVVALEAWRWTTYGALVPNTFLAKPPSPAAGVVMLGSFAVNTLGVLGPMAALWLLRRDALGRALALGGLGLALSIAWSGDDWMPGFRRLEVVLLLLVVLTAVGASLAVGRQRVVALLGVGVWVIASLSSTARGRDGEKYDTTGTASLGRMAQASGITQVALSDIGTFGWHFHGSVFDLFGLTDSHLAKAHGRYGHKAWDEAYFLKRRPDLVILQSNVQTFARDDDERRSFPPNEREVARSLAKNGDYQLRARFPYGRSAWFLVFARTDVELPTAIWGQQK